MTPVPGDSTSSGLHSQCVYVVHTHTLKLYSTTERNKLHYLLKLEITRGYPIKQDKSDAERQILPFFHLQALKFV